MPSKYHKFGTCDGYNVKKCLHSHTFDNIACMLREISISLQFACEN